MLPARDPHNDASTIDPEGLLAALVIAPGTYPRNRFFFLHKDPVVKRVRRQSAQLRGLVRYLMGGAGRVVVDARETHADGSETNPLPGGGSLAARRGLAQSVRARGRGRGARHRGRP